MFTFGFYDSLNGDRKYNAEQMSSIFDGIIEDGVYANVGEAFMVVPGTGLQVIVKTGRAWFKHTWNLNNTWLPLTIEEADIYRPRIDSVVLEVNSNVAVRENSIKVIKGSPATSPTPPTLIHEDGVDQYLLATVRVEAEATSIEESKIEIKVGQGDTPFVTAPLQSIDISDLFNQWNGEFNEWFDNLKLQLTDDVVTNLQNQIDGRVKVSDRATDEDLENGTEGKWIDASMLKGGEQYLVTPVGGIVESPGVDLEELYPEKFMKCDQRVVSDPEIVAKLSEKYFRPPEIEGGIDIPTPYTSYNCFAMWAQSGGCCEIGDDFIFVQYPMLDTSKYLGGVRIFNKVTNTIGYVPYQRGPVLGVGEIDGKLALFYSSTIGIDLFSNPRSSSDIVHYSYPSGISFYADYASSQAFSRVVIVKDSIHNRLVALNIPGAPSNADATNEKLQGIVFDPTSSTPVRSISFLIETINAFKSIGNYIGNGCAFHSGSPIEDQFTSAFKIDQNGNIYILGATSRDLVTSGRLFSYLKITNSEELVSSVHTIDAPVILDENDSEFSSYTFGIATAVLTGEDEFTLCGVAKHPYSTNDVRVTVCKVTSDGSVTGKIIRDMDGSNMIYNKDNSNQSSQIISSINQMSLLSGDMFATITIGKERFWANQSISNVLFWMNVDGYAEPFMKNGVWVVSNSSVCGMTLSDLELFYTNSIDSAATYEYINANIPEYIAERNETSDGKLSNSPITWGLLFLLKKGSKDFIPFRVPNEMMRNSSNAIHSEIRKVCLERPDRIYFIGQTKLYWIMKNQIVLPYKKGAYIAID